MNTESLAIPSLPTSEAERSAHMLAKPVAYSLEAFIPYIGEDSVDSIIETSHLYDPRIVGWDLIRKRGDMATRASSLSGLEGYLVAGLAHQVLHLNPVEQQRYNASPILTPYKNFDIEITNLTLDQMHDFIGIQGENEVAAIKREIPPQKRSLIWNTLAEDGKVSVAALVEIESRFKALLARMRALASMNPQHKKVVKPEIESVIQGTQLLYTFKDGLPIKQFLPKVKLSPDLQQIFTVSDGGYAADTDPSTGLGFMNLIGKVGNPLVRAALNAIDPETKSQMIHDIRYQAW